jgi:virulence factor Mce-like protein
VRRVLLVLCILATAGTLAFLGAGAGDGETYQVKAIFDNSAFVIEGEDVKVAGVRVGQIDKVDITPDFKAAVTLGITDPGYQDFRKDASCIVRPQSLIGEKFIECSPTQKRAVGAPQPPPLERLESGEYFLPVTQTKRSVDLDLLNTVFRRPYAERLTIILNELGTGLAGRGKDLNDVIRRAAPALTETDKVLRILARQNDTLKQLAEDSDTVLAPLARERKTVTSFIANANDVAAATAERRADLEAGINKLAPALRELRPTMTRLRGLTGEMIPVLSDLGDVAPDINRFIMDLGPFSQASVPALDALGDAGEIGGPALQTALPITRDVRGLAKQVGPVATSVNNILSSLKKTKGIERLMDYIFFQVQAINGFDKVGHYLRAALLVNTCSSYTTVPVGGCASTFDTGSARASAASGLPRDKTLANVRRILAGESVDAVLGKDRKKTDTQKLLRDVRQAQEQAQAQAPASNQAQSAPQSPASPTRAPVDAVKDPVDGLLDYLFGGAE